MSYWISDMPTPGTGKNSPKWRGYEADGLADVTTLPTHDTKGTGGIHDVDNETCDYGSECLVIDACVVYKLKSDNTWAVL